LLEVISTPGADAAAADEEDELSDTEAETDVASGEEAAALTAELEAQAEPVVQIPLVQ
jgi:hypothetical protein